MESRLTLQMVSFGVLLLAIGFLFGWSATVIFSGVESLFRLVGSVLLSLGALFFSFYGICFAITPLRAKIRYGEDPDLVER